MKREVNMRNGGVLAVNICLKSNVITIKEVNTSVI